MQLTSEGACQNIWTAPRTPSSSLTPPHPTPPPVFPPTCLAQCSGQMTDERKLPLEASTQGRAGHPATRRGNCGNRTHGVARPWAIAATRFEWRGREQVKEKSSRTPRAPSTPSLYTCNTRRTGGLCPVIRCRADGLLRGTSISPDPEVLVGCARARIRDAGA